MLKAFFTSATGMRAQELLIDNTANNLANVNTAGFKKSHIEFADLIYDVSKMPGVQTTEGQTSPIGLQIGSGVRAVGTTTVFSQGVPTPSESPTHMAIMGEGFFKVALAGSQFGYTRDGSFNRDAQGQLVNSDGYLLDPAVNIPEDATDISISDSGLVQYLVNGQVQQGGQIQLYRFGNPAGLRQLGGNLYQETVASGTEQAGDPGSPGFGKVNQKSLEGSNVEVVSEMVALITAQRAYEINSRAIRAGDEMLSNASQIVR